MTIPSKDMIQTEAEARDYAMEWQTWASEQNLSYGELADWSAYFTALAIQFGLTEEYRENWII